MFFFCVSYTTDVHLDYVLFMLRQQQRIGRAQDMSSQALGMFFLFFSILSHSVNIYSDYVICRTTIYYSCYIILYITFVV